MMPETRFCRHVGTRFTRPTYRKLEEKAEREDTTISEIVRQAVLQHLRTCESTEELIDVAAR
jgi:hypothetical protein